MTAEIPTAEMPEDIRERAIDFLNDALDGRLWEYTALGKKLREGIAMCLLSERRATEARVREECAKIAEDKSWSEKYGAVALYGWGPALARAIRTSQD